MIRPLSAAKVRYYRKLHQKKYRRQEGLFIVSGRRAVDEIMASPLEVENLLVDARGHPGHYRGYDGPMYSVSTQELKTISDVQTPQEVAAIVRIPQTLFDETRPEGHLLYLERINDPGNLGTIIRTAAWFGWKHLLLSHDSTDPYQPKTVRATAGMIGYVDIISDCRTSTLQVLKEKGYTLWGTDVNGGKDLKSINPRGRHLVMLGSEAHGLTGQAGALADSRLYIKRQGHGESLNMAMAAGIIMHHFSRKEETGS